MTGNQDACIGDDLLWRYIEEDTDDRETEMVRNHISRCSTCFSIVASVLHSEKHPFTAAEMAEADRRLSDDREKLIDDLLRKYKNAEGIAKNGSTDTNALHRTANEGFFGGIIDWLDKMPFVRPAFGVAFLLLIALVAWQGVAFFADLQAPTDRFVYDDRAPFLPSGMRSAEATAEQSNWWQLLHHAIRNLYTMREYESAISTFEFIEPTIVALPADSLTNQVISRLRDVHFYKGLSHFALSRSRVRKLTDQERALHSQKAIRSLTAADSLVKAYGLPNSDREAYYLGLVLGLNGQKEKAMKKLNEVPLASRFHKESIRLIKKWSAE